MYDMTTNMSSMSEEQFQSYALLSVLIFVLTVLIYFSPWRKRSRKDQYPALPPGSRGQWPILGDTLRLLSPRTMSSYQVESRRIYGNIWRTNVLFNNCVFVASSDLLRELSRVETINKNATSACFPPQHKQLFGHHSVLVTNGSEHSRLRSLIGPTLSPSPYLPEITLAATEFLDSCISHGTNYFPLVPELKRFTLRVTLRVLFGNELWNQLEANQQLDPLIKDINCWSAGLLAPPTPFLPWTIAGKAKKARTRIRSFILNLIHTVSASTDAKASLLTSLIRTRTHIGDEQTNLSHEAIIDNILTLLFAGTDTTASILTSTFFILAKNNHLLQRLQKSVDDKKELDAFFTEIQRLYPAAPFTMRVVNAEDGIQLGGFHIPKGFFITYALAAALLDDSGVYPDPSRFDMDRWIEKLDEAEATFKKCHEPWRAPPIWSFGGGTRTCPGRFLANAESVVLIQQVLKSKWVWTLDPNQNLNYQYHPGFFPIDGLRIRLGT